MTNVIGYIHFDFKFISKGTVKKVLMFATVSTKSCYKNLKLTHPGYLIKEFSTFTRLERHVCTVQQMHQCQVINQSTANHELPCKSISIYWLKYQLDCAKSTYIGKKYLEM